MENSPWVPVPVWVEHQNVPALVSVYWWNSVVRARRSKAARADHRRHTYCPSTAPSAVRVRSEEHTSELSHVSISYAVFCLKKKTADTDAQRPPQGTARLRRRRTRWR